MTAPGPSPPCILETMGEFDLIARYFKRPVVRAVLGIGDDCALLQPTPNTQMAISSDMLVEGRHFFADVDPRTLGHKALAVNLSDLAACGATPRAFTLALSLPQIDEAWLAGFSTGLLALADAHGCELVGGDTTRGPLNLCITVFGEVPVVDGRSQALLRSGAQVGDDVYVSGTLGDARLALDALRGRITLPDTLLASARQRLESPTPRVALGQALRGLATSAIDLSDGLPGDLGHILSASNVGATLDVEALSTLMASSRHATWTSAGLPAPLAFVLAGGDDYELAFTAAPTDRAAIAAAALTANTPVVRIGQVEAEHGLRLRDAQGAMTAHDARAFDHFAAS